MKFHSRLNQPRMSVWPCLAMLTLLAAPSARADVLWREDFEDCHPGTPPAGWHLSAPNGAGTVAVTAAPIAVAGDTEHERCLCLDDKSSEHQLLATRQLPVLESRFVVEYDTMLSANTDQACTSLYVNRAVCLAYTTNNLIYFDGTVAKRALPYVPGTWHHVRYVIDTQAQVFSLYLNERLIAVNIKFRTPTPQLSALHCETGQLHSRGALYVDNIVVRSLTGADTQALQAAILRAKEEKKLRENYSWLDATTIDVPENWNLEAWYRRPAAPHIHYDLSAGVKLDDTNPLQSHAIVVGAETGEVERFAAAELQKYLFRITDAFIPIVTKPSASHEVLFHIGNQLDPRLKDQDEDNFVIVAESGQLTLSGAGDRGTLYSVYGFLEEHLGCRWYYPDPKDEVIPPTNIGHLKALLVKGIDQVERPVMTYRESMILGNDAGPDDARERLKKRLVHTVNLIDWMAKNRFNTAVIEGSLHNMKLLPDNWDLVRTISPEIRRRGLHLGVGGHLWTPFLCDQTPGWPNDDRWGALVDGERHGLKLFSHLGRFCTTNEAALTAFLREVVCFYRANPEFDVWANWPPDSGPNSKWCSCDVCSMFSPSHRVLKIFNQTAKALEHEAARPGSPIHGKTISVILLGYGEWATPPGESMELPANFAVMPDIYRNFNTPYDVGGADAWKLYMTENGGGDLIMFGRWCRSLLVGYHLLPPPSIPQTVKNLVRDGYCGVENFHGSGGWWVKGLWLYTTGRAMWNPDVDLPVLIEDYFTTYYGPAAKPMRAFYEANEEAHTDCRGNFAYARNFDLAWGYTPNVVCAGLNPDKDVERVGIIQYLDTMLEVGPIAEICFEEAEAIADDAPNSEGLLKRIRKAEISWRYYQSELFRTKHEFDGLRCLERAYSDSTDTAMYLAHLFQAQQAFQKAEQSAQRHRQFIRDHTCLYSDFSADHGTLWDGGAYDAALHWAPDRANSISQWLAIVARLRERAEGKNWGDFNNERLWKQRYPTDESIPTEISESGDRFGLLNCGRRFFDSSNCQIVLARASGLRCTRQSPLEVPTERRNE